MNEDRIGIYSIDEIYETLTENVEGSFLNRSMVDAMIFEIKDLQQENLQLKIQLLEKKCSDKDIEYKEKIKLQQRIDKAIEYMENHIVATETEEILLKILKGEENENR